MAVDSLVEANVLTAELDVPIEHPIALEDDTLRDGEQSVGVCFTVDQKIEIARRLLDAGIRRLSVGFLAVSEQERAAARAVMALGYTDRMLYSLSRAMTSDIDATAACGVNNIALFVPISDVHLQYKLQCDEDTALERTLIAVRYARERGFDEVGVGLEDASRAPLRRVLRFVKELTAAGADSIGLCDTVGILTPHSTASIVKSIVAVLPPGKKLGVHFHNDLGMAVANSIVAAQAGASNICGSFAGLGERAGNAALEEVATILRVKFGLDLGLDLAKLIATARRIAEIAKLPVAPCKAIIGANVFSHESGIHVHGITSEPATYEAFPPALIGREHEIHYGKHSGLHSMRYLAAKHGIAASDAAMEQTLADIKATTAERGCPTPEEAAAMLRSYTER